MAYDHSSASPGFDASEGVVYAREVAEKLGVEWRTVLVWARAGRLPWMRTPGGEWRFSAKWLREYVNQGGPDGQ